MKKLLALIFCLVALPALAGSPPNFAYVYGTTPNTSAILGLEAGLNSLFLGVNTTVTSGAITGSGTAQAVTVASATNIAIGSALWVNWGASDQEAVSITNVSGTSITGIFTQNHAASATIGVGLNYENGITNPWSKPVYTGGTNIAAVYLSTALTASGDVSYVPVFLGYSSSANTFGLATADDIDNSGSAASPRDYANWLSGTGISPSAVTLQQTSFSWWAVLTEFGVVVVMDVAGTYDAVAAGQLRSPFPLSQRGVGTASAAIAASATSVTLTTDISTRIAGGQSVLILNQSHNSTSTYWASAPALMTVATVTGNGTTSTITFTAGTPRAFDTGAMVGAITPLYTFNGAVTAFDNSTYYCTRLLDGTWTSNSGQPATADNAVITSPMVNYQSPTLDPQTMFAGELDLPIYFNTASKTGIGGFVYGTQEFAKGSTANQDVFYDGSGPFVWKEFLSGAAIGLGPLSNAQNTQTNPTGWVP